MEDKKESVLWLKRETPHSVCSLNREEKGTRMLAGGASPCSQHQASWIAPVLGLCQEKNCRALSWVGGWAAPSLMPLCASGYRDSLAGSTPFYREGNASLREAKPSSKDPAGKGGGHVAFRLGTLAQ